MKCNKCGYEYDGVSPACPLCGQPGEGQDDAQSGRQSAQAYPPNYGQQQNTGQQQNAGQWQPPQQGQPYGQQSGGWQQQPQRGGYGQGYAQLPPDQGELSSLRGGATASLVCGILSILMPFIGIALGIIAVIFGNKSRKKLPESERGLASAGFAFGIVGLVVQAIIIIMVIIMVSMSFLFMDTMVNPYYDYRDGYGDYYEEYFGDYFDDDYYEYDWDGFSSEWMNSYCLYDSPQPC